MRNWITFAAGFFGSLGTTFTAKVPITTNEWVVAIIVALGIAFGMLGVKAGNSAMKRKEIASGLEAEDA